MFEFLTMPPATNIMRHRAATAQRQALLACTDVANRTGHTVTAAGLTALQLLGAPLPESSTLNENLVDCVVFSRKTRFAVHGAACHVWSNVTTLGAVIEVGTVECLSPEAAFAFMGRHLSLLDLVKLADSLTCRDEMLHRTTLDEIWNFIRNCTPFAGRAKCEHALCLARERTDSPKETETRLALDCEAFPEMTTNYLLETESGQKFLDLASEDYRIAVEFDGRHHLSRIGEDHERINDIQSRLWTVFVIDNDTLQSTSRRNQFLDTLERAFRNAGAQFTRRHMTLDQLADLRKHRGRFALPRV